MVRKHTRGRESWFGSSTIASLIIVKYCYYCSHFSRFFGYWLCPTPHDFADFAVIGVAFQGMRRRMANLVNIQAVTLFIGDLCHVCAQAVEPNWLMWVKRCLCYLGQKYAHDLQADKNKNNLRKNTLPYIKITRVYFFSVRSWYCTPARAITSINLLILLSTSRTRSSFPPPTTSELKHGLLDGLDIGASRSPYHSWNCTPVVSAELS